MENKNPLNISPDEYLDLFNKAMKKLEAAVDKVMGEERMLIYFEQLHKYSIDQIQEAVDMAIHDEEYSQITPVGKIIRYIEEIKEAKWKQYKPICIDFELKTRMLTREENREEAIKALKFITEKIQKLEVQEADQRKKRWEIRKKIIDSQKNLLRINEVIK